MGFNQWVGISPRVQRFEAQLTDRDQDDVLGALREVLEA
jgi:hypothetical protein